MSDNHHSVRRLSLSQHERELHDSRTGEKGQSSLVEEDADEESLEAEMTSSDEEEEDEAEELTEGDDVFFLQVRLDLKECC